MRIYVGSDHGGFLLKSEIIKKFRNKFELLDVGCYSAMNSYDYPDIAENLCREINNDKNSFGILICGTGIGMSIAANKIKNVRCALCNDLFSAEMAKKHNNANVIALGARIIAHELAFLIIEKFIKHDFEYRHQQRIYKLHQLEISD